MMKQNDPPLTGLQMGGYIGNCVACGLMIFNVGRAAYKFHMTGGIRCGEAKGLEEPLLVNDNCDDDVDVEKRGKDGKMDDNIPTDAPEDTPAETSKGGKTAKAK